MRTVLLPTVGIAMLLGLCDRRRAGPGRHGCGRTGHGEHRGKCRRRRGLRPGRRRQAVEVAPAELLEGTPNRHGRLGPARYYLRRLEPGRQVQRAHLHERPQWRIPVEPGMAVFRPPDENRRLRRRHRRTRRRRLRHRLAFRTMLPAWRPASTTPTVSTAWSCPSSTRRLRSTISRSRWAISPP